ncbi:sugar transferase [Spirosoma taeanense]|uniref:Sugar transferase n=1 Tax=Spirosoma taeanense TaxID=2735870 RepID=A0A6M5Y4N7_9BACT|nr:sugar transferase [Spirosoma taeanense]QJW88151.1 sugar transferase [Spirosoma taeanense]
MATSTVAGPHFRVLYLERDPEAALLFIRAFGQYVTIETLEDSEEAIAYLREGNAVDIVVINEQNGGFQFLQTVRESPFLRSIPVLLMTPRLTPAVQRRALELKAIDVYPITFREEDLRLRLDYLIRRKQYLAERSASANGISWTTSEATAPAPLVSIPKPTRMPLWKRSFDVLVSATALTLLSPLMALVALIIRLDSKGPVLYRSKRVGSGYRTFDMYKFRTMNTGADQLIGTMASQNIYSQAAPKTEDQLERCEVCTSSGIECQRPLFLNDKQICEHAYRDSKRAKAMFMKFREDPRVTRLGRFLRNTSIDELPQLFNILLGDMSLVGNRPLPLYEAERLTTTGFAQRFAAPAGLTGLWQVMKRAKGQERMSDLERIQLDVRYAETFSFRTDFQIMLKTITAVWQKENV